MFSDVGEENFSLIFKYGRVDGEHHKQWLLNKIDKTIAEEKYNEWVSDYNSGEDGPNTYEWDEGIAP